MGHHARLDGSPPSERRVMSNGRLPDFSEDGSKSRQSGHSVGCAPRCAPCWGDRLAPARSHGYVPHLQTEGLPAAYPCRTAGPHAPQTQLFSIIVSSITPLVHVLGNLTGTDASLRQASCEAWDLACLLTYNVLPGCDCMCGLRAKKPIPSIYSQARLTKSESGCHDWVTCRRCRVGAPSWSRAYNFNEIIESRLELRSATY